MNNRRILENINVCRNKQNERENSALQGSRTPNLLIRSQMLYPIELGAQYFKEKRLKRTFFFEPQISVHFFVFQTISCILLDCPTN